MMEGGGSAKPMQKKSTVFIDENRNRLKGFRDYDATNVSEEQW